METASEVEDRLDDLCRVLNERIWALGDLGPRSDVDFVCECDDPRCFGVMPMTAAEYEQLRALPNARAVLPQHRPADADPVWATDRFAVLAT